MKLLGIDVSLWQRDIDFVQAKSEGVEFCIIKASEGNFTDPCFDKHYAGCVNAGLHVGAYHYLTAKTVSAAEEQARYFLKVIEGKAFDMPVYLDIEGSELFKNDPSYNAELALAFLRIVSAAGHLCGVYTYTSFLRWNLDASKLTEYPMWLAEITTERPAVSVAEENFGIWQYGGDRNLIRSNMIGGVVCDQNYCYIDYPAIIAGGKEDGMVDFNSFPGTDNEPAEWSREAVEFCVESGIMGGDELGLRLRDDCTREQMCCFIKRLYDKIKGE